MFIENILGYQYDKEDYRPTKLSRLDKVSCSYSYMYKHWRNFLFERIMRLFIWENTYDVTSRKGIQPKEIEQRLILQGHCGISMFKGDLTAFFGTFYGVTKYQDEWSNYNVRCPIYSGKRTIGKDIVVINNNALRNPTYDLVHYYAVLVGHTDVPLINTLINARDSGGVPIAGTEKQKASIKEYQAKLFNGVYDVVLDPGFLGITYGGSDRKTQQDLMKIMETREKLIKSFYSDIGVRSAFEKRNNTVQAEVEADTSLLLLNLSDMLLQRENACEEVNNMFGTNWSVHVAEEIDYGAENERIQFDSSTETHIVEDEDGLKGGEHNAI